MFWSKRRGSEWGGTDLTERRSGTGARERKCTKKSNICLIV